MMMRSLVRLCHLKRLKLPIMSAEEKEQLKTFLNLVKKGETDFSNLQHCINGYNMQFVLKNVLFMDHQIRKLKNLHLESKHYLMERKSLQSLLQVMLSGCCFSLF